MIENFQLKINIWVLKISKILKNVFVNYIIKINKDDYLILNQSSNLKMNKLIKMMS